MQFISEDIINEKLNIYDNHEEMLVNEFKTMVEAHTSILSFFQQESLVLLTESEKGLLEFMFTVIYSSSQSSLGKPLVFNISTLEKTEEKNWEVFNAHSSKKFTQICDIFFENYPQEDLLAFVEDSLQMDDDEAAITSVGREIILIACKSFIDVLNESNG